MRTRSSKTPRTSRHRSLNSTKVRQLDLKCYSQSTALCSRPGLATDGALAEQFGGTDEPVSKIE